MSTECVTCTIYRPDQPPRSPHTPPVCDGCRHRLDRTIGDLFVLHEQIVNPDPDPEYERHRAGRDSQGRTVWKGVTVAPIPGRTNQPHVSGSRAKQIPVNVDHIDLTAPARTPNPTPVARRWPHDQIGHLSVATRLYEIARDWRDTLWPDQHLPVPTVAELVAWLRAGFTDIRPGVRVDEACTRHPAIAATAAELWELRGNLRTAVGDVEQPPRRWLGVACGRCSALSQLSQPDGDPYAECGHCGTLYSDQEMRDLIAGQAERERAARTPDHVAALLNTR